MRRAGAVDRHVAASALPVDDEGRYRERVFVMAVDDPYGAVVAREHAWQAGLAFRQCDRRQARLAYAVDAVFGGEPQIAFTVRQ